MSALSLNASKTLYPHHHSTYIVVTSTLLLRPQSLGNPLRSRRWSSITSLHTGHPLGMAPPDPRPQGSRGRRQAVSGMWHIQRKQRDRRVAKTHYRIWLAAFGRNRYSQRHTFVGPQRCRSSLPCPLVRFGGGVGTWKDFESLRVGGLLWRFVLRWAKVLGEFDYGGWRRAAGRSVGEHTYRLAGQTCRISWVGIAGIQGTSGRTGRWKVDRDRGSDGATRALVILFRRKADVSTSGTFFSSYKPRSGLSIQESQRRLDPPIYCAS